MSRLRLSLRPLRSDDETYIVHRRFEVRAEKTMGLTRCEVVLCACLFENSSRVSIETEEAANGRICTVLCSAVRMSLEPYHEYADIYREIEVACNYPTGSRRMKLACSFCFHDEYRRGLKMNVNKVSKRKELQKETPGKGKINGK